MNASMLAAGCEMYAIDNEGRFPASLSELQPGHVPNLDALHYVAGNGRPPRAAGNWIYLGAGFTRNNPPPILVAGPDFFLVPNPFFRFVKASRFRIYGSVSSSGGVFGNSIPEEEYQRLLAETNRQISGLQKSESAKLTKP